MARTNGPIQVWSRNDTTPTDVEGGYAGGDSTAAAVGTSLDQSGKALGTVDNLAVTASTLDYGQEATATISGTSPYKTIHVGIPKGMPESVGQQLVTDAQTSADAAAQSAADADAAVALAQQAQAAAYEVPDTAMSDIINNPATETRVALSDHYEDVLRPATYFEGGTDVSADIAARFQDAQEVHLKGLTASYYPVASPIVVPAGKTLRVPSGTRFIPTGNHDVFRVEEGGILDGPMIQVNGITGYTAAAVAIYGTTTFSAGAGRTTISNVYIRGKTGASGEGYGVLMDTGTGETNHIAFVNFHNIRIWGMASPVTMHARVPVAGLTWINGCMFDGLVMFQGKRGLDILVDGPEARANGNQIDNMQMQCVDGQESAMHIEGSMNAIHAFIWDWDSTVGVSTVSTVLTPRSSQNVLNTNEIQARVRNHGAGNTVNINVTGTQGRYPVRHMGAPGGQVVPAKYGEQDDWLAFAADRGDAVAGTAPAAGALRNLFDPDGALTVRWDDAGVHTVTTTWTAGVRGDVYGVVFSAATAVPDTVQCEVLKGGVWTQVLSVVGNTSTALEAIPYNPNDFGVTGVRWTFTGFSAASSSIEVERLWMFEQRAPGRTWAARHNPVVTGSLNLGGLYLRNNGGVLEQSTNGSTWTAV